MDTIRQRIRSYSWTKLLTYFGITLAVVKLLLKIKAQLAEWERRKKILLVLPTYKHNEPPHKYQPPVLADINQFLPPGVKPSQDNVARHSLSQLQRIQNSVNKNDGVFMIWVVKPSVPGPPVGSIVVKDIKLIRQLLSTKMLPYLRKGLPYRISHPLIGDGVLATSGPTWHKQRIVLEKGFTPTLISKQYPLVLKTANELVARFHSLSLNSATEGATVDTIEEMLKTTLDVLGRVAFSYDFGSVTAATKDEAPLYNAFDTILYGIAARVRNPSLHVLRKVPFLPHNRKMNKSLNHLFETIRKIIRSRVDKKNAVPQDLLDIMLSEVDPDSKSKLTQREIMDNIATLLFAGHDTTAAALTWFCYMIAKHPKVGEKILEELNTTWGGKITHENMEKSSYLNACTLEVLRLYPSAGFVRQTTEDIHLGNYLIPKHQDIYVFPYINQRNEDYYENAEEFIPERWMKGDATEKLGFQARLARESLQNPLLPFSLGKRNCVGRPLALLEIRLVLLRLLQEFDIRLPEEQHPLFQETPWMGLTAYPMHINLKFLPKKAK